MWPNNRAGCARLGKGGAEGEMGSRAQHQELYWTGQHHCLYAKVEGGSLKCFKSRDN